MTHHHLLFQMCMERDENMLSPFHFVRIQENIQQINI